MEDGEEVDILQRPGADCDCSKGLGSDEDGIVGFESSMIEAWFNVVDHYVTTLSPHCYYWQPICNDSQPFSSNCNQYLAYYGV